MVCCQTRYLSKPAQSRGLAESLNPVNLTVATTSLGDHKSDHFVGDKKLAIK